MNKLLIASLVATLASMPALAQTKKKANKEGETAVKLEEVKPANTTPNTGEQDVDEVITNRKLRAETGSKNKYSASAALSYHGGSLEKPLSSDRPNITGALGTPVNAAISGSVGVKYKISTLQSMSLDIGVGMSRPFSDDQGLAHRSYADNPSLSYQVLYKAAGIQNVTSVGVNAYTRTEYRKIGYQSGLGVQQTAIYDFGGSKFSVGLLGAFGINYFDKNDAKLAAMQGDYSAGLYPFLEYVISDRLNVRTISGLWVYDHDRAHGDFWTWSKNKIYQSIGLGVSITRDIFLYPNIQFLPENMRSDATNVGVSANINI